MPSEQLGFVASVAVRIESGAGGPETDSWVLEVEVAPGVVVTDARALALALVGTLGRSVPDLVDALERLSGSTIHHPDASPGHAAEVPKSERPALA